MSSSVVVMASGVLVLVGAVVRGYTGFGASMLWVASLSLVYPPSVVVPTVLLLEVLASVVLLRSAWSHVEWSSMRWLLASSLLVTPLGVALLAVVPERPMRAAVGIAILAGAAAMGFGARRHGRPTTRSALLAGGVSGIINGATAVGGPPAVVLYFSGEDVRAGRSTLVTYFLAMDAFAVVIMAGRGLVDGQVLGLSAWLAPLAIAGIWTGKRLFEKFGVIGFRGVVLAVLVLLGTAILLRALLVG